ncbi:pectate lyase [Sorangium cellulosum]|uniref:pectate lyase n=1 Tax=Sorangium cellulosum TaxID=56 RepID=A0A2L0ESV0_SORCE|nr:pectate lyase [Sorangium cellulosum]AUX42355.1 pectate lyase [Sorangium cellulosum]
MNFRLTYALGALLSCGVAGCLAADEASVDLDSTSGALSTVRIEAEDQSWSISSGDRIEDNADNVKLRANQSGDTFSFSTSVASGKYKIVLRHAKRNVYGKYELRVKGSSVKSFDAYASSTGDSWTTTSLGEKTLSGNVEFTLKVKGKSSSASGYDLKVDYIELVPVGGGDSGDDDTGSGDSGSGDSGGGDSGGGDSGGTTTAGDGGVVSATIVVRSGETFDGGGKRFIADRNTLGDGSQKEGQKPVFKLEDGAKLKNVVLGAPAADGIHTYGDVTLENIVWEDIGEDAMTIKESGTVVLNGGSAKDGEDKVFQINAASTFKVSNFKAQNAGKFIRQNGGTGFKVDVVIDQCDISKMKESIFRTDSSSSTVKMTNTRYSDIGDELFLGVRSSNITTSNNTEY